MSNPEHIGFFFLKNKVEGNHFSLNFTSNVSLLNYHLNCIRKSPPILTTLDNQELSRT